MTTNQINDVQEEIFCLEEEETLEELLEQAKEKVDSLEDTSLPLEEAFRMYEEGMKLIARCNEKIDAVEQKMQVITGTGALVDFDEEYK